MTGKKKVLMITNRFHPQIGGAEMYEYNLARELAKYVDLDVLTPIRDRDRRREALDGYHVIRSFNAFNPLGRFPYLPSRTLCPSVVTRTLFGGYDLIHCFPALSHNNKIALLLSRLVRVPMFLTNFDLFDYAALMGSGMDVADFGGLKLPRRSARRLSRFNAILTISEKETALIGAVNPNTFLSKVPVDMDEFRTEADGEGLRRRLGIPSDKKIILCLSRVSHIKGQDILLKSLPALRARMEDFEAVFVGRTDFEPEYAAELESFVDANDLGGHVRFTGPLSREDALAAMKMCDVHVLPMRFMNSGSINTETWMSGRPIIQSSRVDPNYVEEGVNGFTFNIDEPETLIDALVRVLTDPDLANRMGENGKRLAMKEFHYPALISQYLDVYRKFGGIEV